MSTTRPRPRIVAVDNRASDLAYDDTAPAALLDSLSDPAETGRRRRVCAIGHTGTRPGSRVHSAIEARQGPRTTDAVGA